MSLLFVQAATPVNGDGSVFPLNTAGKKNRSNWVARPVSKAHGRVETHGKKTWRDRDPSVALPHCWLGNKRGTNGNQAKRWKRLHESLKKIKTKYTCDGPHPSGEHQRI
jgi:hypothetical protein